MLNGIGNANPANLARSQNKLKRNQTVVKWLREALGLTDATVRKFYLGLSEPLRLSSRQICTDALTVPLIACDGEPKKKRIYNSIPLVTVNAASDGWNSGKAIVYYSADVRTKKRVFVCSDLKQLWLLDQISSAVAVSAGIHSLSDILFVAATGTAEIPEEFTSPEFWADFEEVYFGHDRGEAGDKAATGLRNFCFSDVKRVVVPEGSSTWTEFFLAGGADDAVAAVRFTALLEGARSMSSGIEPGIGELDSMLGEFAVDSVNCNGGYVRGFMYYPYQVEKREIERITHRGGSVTETVVSSYQTKIVRSDGTILDVGYLPAPRGCNLRERVLALSDGTRVSAVPSPNLYASWQLESILTFIRHLQSGKKAPHRPLREILGDLENHFRRSIWLPDRDDYTVLALYTALSFVYNVFEAIPLLLIRGAKGTGKTELGLAIEAVAFNSVILGQATASSAVRVAHESRGLIVWDDLENIAGAGDALGEKNLFTDKHQMLKLSYKKKTSKKTVTDRGGKTTVLDFYGPKVINNTGGVDSILGSRMISIRTGQIPFELRGGNHLPGSDPDFTYALRNELHIWGMSRAAEIDRRYRKLLPECRSERNDEIFLPLRVISELSGNREIIEKLQNAAEQNFLSDIVPIEPIELLKESLETCIAAGYSDEVSLPHIQLQMAALGRGKYRFATIAAVSAANNLSWSQSQWIGTALDGCAFKDKRAKVSRRRLHGKETRIYKLDAEFVNNVYDRQKSKQEEQLGVKKKDPFQFCERVECRLCPFTHVCEETVPWLKKAKNRREKYRARRGGE
jgi:hypothetical protein